MNEASNYGNITIKRAYGDWTRQSSSTWRGKLLDYSIIPMQQFNNTFGKNSSDSALIIDAMNILYRNNVDGFILVSSDSDFTRLAATLKEEGKVVVGMGESKTPVALRNACDYFKVLDLLYKEANKSQKFNSLEPTNEASAGARRKHTGSARPEGSVHHISFVKLKIHDII